MDIEKIGKAISFLRKRAGYTQKDLADRIGISDKAVSKWERGQGLPDISYLRRLSILLDTDTDSLLAGDIFHHGTEWQGIIVLEDNIYGIGAETVIYDKPLIFFLLSYFLLVGIKNISVVCSEKDKQYIDKTLSSGEKYGISLEVYTDGLKSLQPDYVKNTMVVYGRCLLYGVDQTRFFQKAMMDKKRLTVMAFPKKIGNDRILMDINKKVVNSGGDKPISTQYDYTDIPILFCPPKVLPELQKSETVRDFITNYTADGEMYVQLLDRGFVEIEIDTWDDVQEASAFMRIVQNKCGMNVYCIEEVAWRRGLISLEQLGNLAEQHAGTEYGEYIMSLYERVKLNASGQSKRRVE